MKDILIMIYVSDLTGFGSLVKWTVGLFTSPAEMAHYQNLIILQIFLDTHLEILQMQKILIICPKKEKKKTGSGWTILQVNKLTGKRLS